MLLTRLVRKFYLIDLIEDNDYCECLGPSTCWYADLALTPRTARHVTMN